MLLATLGAGPLLPAQDWFKAPLMLDAAWGTIRLAGDLDGDGDLDAIRFFGPTFTVLHNDGRCRFTDGASYTLPDNGSYVVLADVDGDGDSDLVASTLNSSPLGAGLLVFHGTAGATFAGPVHVPLGGNVTNLVAGHVDNDGIPDLAVIHFAPGTTTNLLRWLRGNTGRSYLPGPAVTLTGTVIANDLTVLDANGDGLDDLAFVDGLLTGLQLRFLHTVAGVPSPGPVLALPDNYGIDLAACDLDGDGDTDLSLYLLIGNVTSQLTSLRNQGGGSWTPGPTLPLPWLGFAWQFAGDWDGDGDLDLIARHYESSTGQLQYYHACSLLENDGTGSFTVRASFTVHGQSEYLGGIGIVELNGDGHPDFLDSSSAWCGDGTMAGPFATHAAPHRPVDWDDDGDLDVPSWSGSVLINDGRGQLTAVQWGWPAPPANHVFREQVVYADLDGDGLQQALVPMFQVQFLQYVFVEMRRFADDGTGRFVDRGPAAPPGAQIQGRVFVDDADGDGDLDLITPQGIWQNSSTHFFTLVPGGFGNWRPTAMGDVDADGDQDFLALPYGGRGAALLRRTGPLTYQVEVLAANIGNIVGDAGGVLADLDDDGDLDVAAFATPNQTTLTIFVNQGGTFAAAGSVPMVTGTALAADADSDGRTDLITSNGQRLQVWRRNHAGFTYDPVVVFTSPPVTAFADLDQDGDPDGVGAGLRNRRFDGPAAGMRRQYGDGTPGAGGRRPLLGAAGVIRSGSTPVLRLRQAAGGSFAALAVGTAETNLPNHVIPGLTLYTRPILTAIGLPLPGTAGQPGAGAADVPIPVPPGFTGLRLFFQVIVFDPAVASGVACSNGLEFLVGQ